MIFLGADHRGYKLKESIKEYLSEKEVEYDDKGTYSEEKADFPEIAKQVCSTMNLEKDKAILICGSGIGMSMVANKFKGIRAGVCLNETYAVDGKEHSNMNVLVLPGDFVKIDKAISIIEVWLKSVPLDGRYLERRKMIEKIEEENMK